MYPIKLCTSYGYILRIQKEENNFKSIFGIYNKGVMVENNDLIIYIFRVVNLRGNLTHFLKLNVDA